ncbi:MAG TPA: bifunctional alpha,alpha-trehalose-phosphate synthase (UDP-forming)/trehalose-phosphatase [Vicinamibacterales bacterium]|nr:bifunctional alpha,alpha-trehalose-phosphate synthase (UDP-forming)/trehalose-phosphatase [Vicinamibacterales bacterium]
MSSERLLIVSNRLPVSAWLGAGRVRLSSASGGLATGLKPWHERSNGLWIGWPGDISRFSDAQRAELDRELAARGIAPVHLTSEHIDRYYHGFSNRVIWPLFHYLIDRVPVQAAGWEAYRQVNQLFADLVAREYRPGDTIWVHDYQLMLVPSLLRERLPEARIGFFLHIPFPSSEVFRTLPWRAAILDGLLGADLIGFHTFGYLRHFLNSLQYVRGIEADIDRVRLGERDVKVGVFPMGVDAARFTELARDADVAAEAEEIRREAGGRRILLGIDRLDYTKGIPRRLQAVARLLTAEPELRDKVRYIQVAVPSRGEVDAYQRFKRQVEESVGRINGACGTVHSAPIHYMHRSVPLRQLVALFAAADVMLVTPLRDGMNLVAKEFVASRVDEDGVLVLSEFAGAAAELDGAMVVNPYDVDGVAETIRQALAMPVGERRARMTSLRRRVAEHDIHAWARGFLTELQTVRRARDEEAASQTPSLAEALGQARRGPHLRLLLDYDGTLVPIARSPDLAAPDDELLRLIESLAEVPGLELDIVSGRPRPTLEAWLGHLPISLWAEHGFWHRPASADSWDAAVRVDPDWASRILPILQHFTARTPGSLIETKSASLTWHYRRAQKEFGARQAQELRLMLGEALSNQPFEVIEGKKVIDVRPRGVSKALVAHRIQEEAGAGAPVIAIGDDRTDEDLFAALQPDSVTIAVGQRPSRARFHVPDHKAVRRLLATLLAPAGPDGLPGPEPGNLGTAGAMPGR